MDKYLKNKKINFHSKNDIEFHEIFLDELAQKKDVLEEKIEKLILNKISFNFFFFTFLLFFIFFIKVFELQIIDGKNFSALAERNKFGVHQIHAERGVIYDQSLNQLVFNQPSFDLVLNIRELPRNKDRRLSIFKNVSEIIKKDINILKEKIEKPNLDQILILENLPHQTLILLETKINNLPGFTIQRNLVRYYQNGEMFSHLIGHTGKITLEEFRSKEGQTIFDWVGRTGVEKYYENILRGIPGKTQIKRDTFGNIVSKENVLLPKSGKSLVLWLDSDLQKKITQELKKSIENVGSKSGVAIALDARTGGVLSLISYPNFDNNLFQKGGDEETLKYLLNNPLNPLFNRVISGRFAPGSTIKPFIAAAALEEKLINTQTRIFSDGKIEIPHRYDPNIVFTFRDVRPQGFGWTDVRKAIADSVNTFFYAIGGGYREQRGLGPYLMKKYLEMFNWGQKTGIDLPEENKGLLPSPSWKRETMEMNWRLGDSYLFSIGQGNVLATPLQLAVSTLAIANDGKLLEPRVVKKIISTNSEEIISPQIIRQDFITPKTLEIVKEGMRQAVTNGTARRLNNSPVKVAAKTGTAETPIKGHYHHWITLFAPYEDPEIVLTIMVENIEGARLATLPVAQAVLDWYFTREEK